MAKSKMWHLVAYDVREAKRLRKTERCLKGYGERLQYSLFRCRMTQREVERLRYELSRILEEEDDLLVVALCQGCAGRVAQKSGKDDWASVPKMFAVI